MRYEDKILKKTLEIEQVALKRRVAAAGAKTISELTPYLDEKGAFKLDYLAKLATDYVNWINSIESDDRVVKTSDGVQLMLDDMDVPEALKPMIWPRSIKLDPTSYYMYDLIDRHDAEPLSFADIENLLRGWNAYLYGEASVTLHTVKVGSLRTDVALMNYIDNIAVAVKETEDADEEYLCKSSVNGSFKVLVDGLNGLMTVRGYFDMPLVENDKLLEKNFKLDI